MPDAPTTRPSLLVRLRDPGDGGAWAEFVDLYAPLVYGHVRRRGLQDADAADLTQDVLHAVAASVGRLDYDPRRGSFRGWLFTIVRNRLRNFLARAQGPRRASGDPAVRRLLEEYPAPEQESAEWDDEYRQRLFAWAAARVRGEVREATWLAFWRTAVEGRPVRATADELGLSLASVYLARSRVMARLKAAVQQIQDEEPFDPPKRCES